MSKKINKSDIVIIIEIVVVVIVFLVALNFAPRFLYKTFYESQVKQTVEEMLKK